MKAGDLIYCWPWRMSGVVIGFNHSSGEEGVYDILWETGKVSSVGETFVEVVNESR